MKVVKAMYSVLHPASCQRSCLQQQQQQQQSRYSARQAMLG